MPKFSVLIIEDEKNIQTFMGKVLKRHDYQVLYADTGKQGLEMIRSRCPDLILLDLGLPDMDGCSIIRDVRTWASTPIIVISARTAEREKVAALDLGADDYITKPFGTSELLARIRASLRHSNRLLTDSTFYIRPYRHKDLILDFSKRLLTIRGNAVRSNIRLWHIWRKIPEKSLHMHRFFQMYGDLTLIMTIRFFVSTWPISAEKSKKIPHSLNTFLPKSESAIVWLKMKMSKC